MIVRKRKQNKILVLILLIGTFFLAPLIQFFHAPSFIKYFLDITCSFLLITMILKKKRKICSEAESMLKFIIIFLIISGIIYVINYQSIFYYLWSLRNNFRGYIIFFAAIYYFDKKDIRDIFRFFDIMFYFNLLIMLVQFFILGYKQDNLGGIFGVESGCNAYINIFFCIIFIIDYVGYFQKRIKLKAIIIRSIILLSLSGMAELKFFYIEFIILVAIGFLVMKGTLKKILIFIGGIITLGIGLNAIRYVFPDIEMNIAQLIEYATSTKGYTSSGDLNRLFFFSQVNEMFLTNWFKRTFGLGLGNCDYAAGYSFLISPFSELYQEKLHYAWMSTAFMYLEGGYIGLFFLFGFFVLICAFCYQEGKKKISLEYQYYCKISFLISVACIMNGMYNISLRLESGYMIYLILSVTFIYKSRLINYRESLKKFNNK